MANDKKSPSVPTGTKDGTSRAEPGQQNPALHGASDPLHLAGLLIENERLMAQFYRSAGRRFGDLAEAFEILAGEEDAHAKVIERIRTQIEQAPQRFGAGRISATTLMQVADDLRSLIRDVDEDRIDSRYALTRVTSLEGALAERRLGETLTADDPALLAPLHAIAEGFNRHALRLREIHEAVFGPTGPLRTYAQSKDRR